MNPIETEGYIGMVQKTPYVVSEFPVRCLVKSVDSGGGGIVDFQKCDIFACGRVCGLTQTLQSAGCEP